MNKLPSLTFFFPAYNEEANIKPLVEEALQVLPTVAEKYEIIIVDDGSSDKTPQIADELSAEHPGRVRAVHNEPNLGYGGAVKRGFSESKMEWIFFTDGDRQFRLEELPAFMSHADGVDMVIGFRKKRNDPPHRILNAKLYGTMVKLLFGFRARDIDCAYKLIHRPVLDAVRLDAGGALVSAELLAKAKHCGFKWKEVGVNHYPREAGQQTGASLKVIFRMFGELFRNFRRIRSYGREHASGTVSSKLPNS